MLLSHIKQRVTNYRPRELECATGTRASVMLPLFEKEHDLHILLTKRTDRMKVHPGEISFPGGMYEEADADTMQTALRECCEEIGVKSGDVEIAGRLDDMATLTGFVITPYVGIIPYPYEFKISQKEVAYLIYLPFEHLRESKPFQERIEYRGKAETIDCIYYNGERIWGATCRILTTFKQVLEDDSVQQ
jgi:8-oxo-dGTP pyrophosphatase MutT (NUDIX family)